VIRAVLDTGVIIAGAISSLGAPASVLRRWQQGAFELVMCPASILELTRVFAYPKILERVSPQAASRVLRALSEGALLLPDPADVPAVRRDPDDDYLFALAATSSAVLVSGDTDVTGVKDPPVQVLSPTAFAALVAEIAGGPT
jgi:putative PIN family toxin of toxin-antitoxin system